MMKERELHTSCIIQKCWCDKKGGYRERKREGGESSDRGRWEAESDRALKKTVTGAERKDESVGDKGDEGEQGNT